MVQLVKKNKLKKKTEELKIFLPSSVINATLKIFFFSISGLTYSALSCLREGVVTPQI
jgi:hypothetical protein